MEQIYTIPINEAFEASVSDGVSCPFCSIRKKFEEGELDLILGASAMEPDVRIKTNELGFCRCHLGKMLGRGKKLPIALMLESRLDRISKELSAKSIIPALGAKSKASSLSKLSSGCYICERLDASFGKVLENAVYMWRGDDAFRRLFSKVRTFCLPHACELLSTASTSLRSTEFSALFSSVRAVELDRIEKERDKVSRFVKKFDYRYENEPWGDAKEAVEDAMRALCGDEV